MAGANFVFCLVIVHLMGESRGLLDDHCTDQSYYDELHYITKTKQCCKPKLEQICQDKSEEVCKDVMEVRCEPQAHVECRSQTSLANGKKCEAEFKTYDYKDCSKKITTRVDCKQNSVDTCKPKLKIYPDGRAVLTDELTCTPLLYEDCIVVDDAVAGCSRAELEQLCKCADVYEPVCAGGRLYDNLCLYECSKKEAECADVQGLPALEDIAKCVEPDNKGIVNRDAIKDFKTTLLDIENEFASFPDSRSFPGSFPGVTEDEFKLLNKIVEGKMYLEIECSNEEGQCDLEKIKGLIDETISAFNVVKGAGRASSPFKQYFVQEKGKFDVSADVAIKVQEKIAVKKPPQEPEPYVVTVLLELDGITLGRSASDSGRLGGLSRSDTPSNPDCTTPFQIKWTDFVEKDKVIVQLENSCEVKSSVKCERVSVKKCTSLNWKECALRPVQECETVDVSQPNQDKIYQKKCLQAGTKKDDWSVGVELNEDGSQVVTNIGEIAFNSYFGRCPVIQYTRDGAVYAVYVRTTPVPPSFNAFTVFTSTWASTNNLINVDFKLYDSLEDAKGDVGAWAFCNYDDPGVGFPRDCGKAGAVGGKWFSIPGGRFQARGSGTGLQIFTGSMCPAPLGSDPPSRRREASRAVFNNQG